MATVTSLSDARARVLVSPGLARRRDRAPRHRRRGRHLAGAVAGAGWGGLP
jgi:hypothetical protein